MINLHIINRFNRRTIAVIEAPTYARALEWATRRGMSLIDVDLEGLVLRSAFLAHADLRGAGLSGADLAACYLRKADLRGADLCEARLLHTFLGGADLRQADLRDAELSHADLRGAKIVGADLRGTIITGARLVGAICDWRWSVIPAELLRQHPGASEKGSRLVIDMAFYEDRRPWEWLRLLSGYGRRADWALGVLAESVRNGDNAPDLLKCLAADASTSITAGSASSVSAGDPPRSDDDGALDLDHSPVPADIPPPPRMLWTCRRTSVLDATRTSAGP
jgi:uncharacterized protein YjbI with pentapeptide repeats